jgi:hypothetical protein
MQFVAPTNAPPRPSFDDELEEVRRAVNIPKKIYPTKPLTLGNDLDIATSFEVHKSTKINHSDLSHNPNDLCEEDLYGGLDIL